MYVKVYKTKWDLVIDFRSSLISYFLFKKKNYIFKKKKNLNHLDQLNNYFKISDAPLSVITNNTEKIEANNVINKDSML